jgi:hypothetical protein
MVFCSRIDCDIGAAAAVANEPRRGTGKANSKDLTRSIHDKSSDDGTQFCDDEDHLL